MNSCKIRFDVTLSQEYSGRSSQAQQYKIVVGIKIYQDESGKLFWQQLNTPDHRMPAQGSCEKVDNNLVLYTMDAVTKLNRKVATLNDFSLPPSLKASLINYEYTSCSYDKPQPTLIRWKGRGRWTIIHHSWVEGETALGASVGMTTNWEFITSQGVSGGGGPGWTLNVSGGDIVIADKTNPKRQFKLMYGGIGGGISLPKSPGGGVSGSTFDFPSGGLTDIYYGTLSKHIPMRVQDFVGHATFVEISGTCIPTWIPDIKMPVGVGGAVTATIIFFYVPPFFGTIPLTYGAAGIMWGTSVAVGSSSGGSATLFHGYVSNS